MKRGTYRYCGKIVRNSKFETTELFDFLSFMKEYFLFSIGVFAYFGLFVFLLKVISFIFN